MANNTISIVQSVTWRDAKGQTTTTRFFIATKVRQDSIQDWEPADRQKVDELITALAELSNAKVTGYRGGINGLYTQLLYGDAADYQDVEDKLVLGLKTTGGAPIRLEIPAPKATLFQADQETLDRTDVIITGFFDKAKVAMTDRGGNAVDKLVGGFRIRRRDRRANLPLRSPVLSNDG